MIHFNQIANPPMPAYRPVCGACEGRGVVPDLASKGVKKCSACNGTGKHPSLQGVEQEINRLNAQSHEPTTKYAEMQIAVDAAADVTSLKTIMEQLK